MTAAETQDAYADMLPRPFETHDATFKVMQKLLTVLPSDLVLRRIAIEGGARSLGVLRPFCRHSDSPFVRCRRREGRPRQWAVPVPF